MSTTFKPPKGYAVPEGNGAVGDTFQEMCGFRVEQGGDLCLTRMGDVEMEDYKNKSAAHSPTSYADMMPKDALEQG